MQMIGIRCMPQKTNGWITYNNKVIWGNGQRTNYWGGYRECVNKSWINNYQSYPAITRNDPGGFGPCKTEDLDKFTDAMMQYGCPAFQHHYGLWYDRRRDCHDITRRDSPPVSPFFEQPWARSNTEGAWDGGYKYDLLTYLVYASEGGEVDIDLKDESGIAFKSYWMNPRNGNIHVASERILKGGNSIKFGTPDNNDWLLWLTSSLNNEIFN